MERYYGIYQLEIEVTKDRVFVGHISAIIQASHSTMCIKILKKSKIFLSDAYQYDIQELIHVGHGISTDNNNEYCLLVKVSTSSSDELKAALQ